VRRHILLLATLISGGAPRPASLANVGWDGSRTPFVHRISLYDEDGQKIAPDAPGAPPFSARQTCGQCHDDAAISKGWHFNADAAGISNGRPGQAWIHVVPEHGIQIPVTSRGWRRTWSPEAAGLTPWRMTKEFGRHMPGGGAAEGREAVPDPESRWVVSGPLEKNCLACHNASPGQDMGEWARQIGRENFRWAATAASGFAEVAGMASRLPNTWIPSDGRNPDDTEYAVPPSVRYDLAQFDSKGRVLINIGRTPPDSRCLYCHSNARSGAQRVHTDGDVHSARGVNCAACHRHGIDHQIFRGYEGQFMPAGSKHPAGLTCQECHSVSSPTRARSAGGGRLGAPTPTHRGLPPAHLESLRCTVCHSGPPREAGLVHVRTARANRLGIYGAATWDRDVPHIVEPVLMKDDSGRVAPHRMTWPAFWGRLEGETVTPLTDETVAAAAAGTTDVQPRAARILAALATAGQTTATPVLLLDGRCFSADADGEFTPRGAADWPRDNGPGWAWEHDGTLAPLVPPLNPAGFDPYTNAADAAVESDLSAILKALGLAADTGNRTAVLCIDSKLFRLSEEGAVEQIERPGNGTAARPEPAWLEGDTIVPLLDAFEARTIAALAGSRKALTEEQVARVLAALARQGVGGTPVYIANGRLFMPDGAGGLTAVSHPAAEPYAWPLAHDVRPAAQALGAGGCGDCHSADSAFFFATVTARGPLLTTQNATYQMRELMGEPHAFHRLFGLTFSIRPFFKNFLAALSLLIGAMLASAVLVAIAALKMVLAEKRGRSASRWLPLVERLSVLTASLSFLVLAATGFGGTWILGSPLRGYSLLAHTTCGGVFAAALTAVALLRKRTHGAGFPPSQRGASTRRSLCFWAIVAAAWLLIVSILLSMIPLFGTEGQHALLLVHRYSGLAAMAAALAYAWPTRTTTRKKGAA
jgi:hypothetical protein